MTTMKTIANNILIPEIGRMLDEGMEVTLRAKGRSMSPYIRDRKDSLVMRHVDPEEVKVGDVVLAEVSKGHFVVHRIIYINNEEITLMGDGNLYGTEHCTRRDILGKLIYVERNGRRIDCNTKFQRQKAWLMRNTYRPLAKIKHKIKQLL